MGEAKGKSASEERPGPPASAFHPRPHHDPGGGSKQFIVKDGDNSVQEYGDEGSESELKAAAFALHAFLDARAERNWAASCAYLDRSAKQAFAQTAQLKGDGCTAALAALSGRVPTSDLREAAVANVGALRSEGEGAFLIYRGGHGVAYAISVMKERGTWKVASLNGVPLE